MIPRHSLLHTTDVQSMRDMLWELAGRDVLWMQVVAVLKKEIVKTQNKDLEKAAEYRQLLVQAVHSCAVKFPDVAGEAAGRQLIFQNAGLRQGSESYCCSTGESGLLVLDACVQRQPNCGHTPESLLNNWGNEESVGCGVGVGWAGGALVRRRGVGARLSPRRLLPECSPVMFTSTGCLLCTYA